MTGQKTSIKWCSHVWNPFTGCDRVSAGCAHCYAAEVAKGNQRKELGRARLAKDTGNPPPRLRYQNDGDPKTSGPGFKFTVHQDRLDYPPKFPAGARVFVNSMSDVFHEEAPAMAIGQLWGAMAMQPNVDFLILTKRPGAMRDLLREIPWEFGHGFALAYASELALPDWPLPNVWLGVSIENRKFNWRADVLRETPAAVRFISAEPLLGPLVPHITIGNGRGHTYGWNLHGKSTLNDDPGLDLTDIDWLIVGGESGPKHRPIKEQWVRDLERACHPREGEGTAFFLKQWGGYRPDGEALLDGIEWLDFPESRLEVAA